MPLVVNISIAKHFVRSQHSSDCFFGTALKCAGGKRARTPDTWMGGARALRDSHVRLVRRQLRHIERLNRALDHAAPGLKHKQ